ncbi:MAG: S-methyl-5'-thioadenosine phosphorylase [Candidatus Aenigmarchaeota archaeon]|nr:S-methyl-5'-thioadenosine phosphorylase [Candidatus Aenigmarchaeota archaeon]
MRVRVGIIGGTGISTLLSRAVEKNVKTPYGKASDKVLLGDLSGKRVAFIARHGKKHEIPPHSINHRANIYALKSLGVKNIISTSSVGIINANIRIGDFIILDDFLDFTKKPYTFFDKFDKKPVHVDLTNPFSPKLREILIGVCKEKGYSFQEKGIYVNTSGPRLETPAEIRMFNNLGADVVGQTIVPEVILSRELGIEYASIAVGVNYACGISEKPLSYEEVEEGMKRKEKQLKEIIKEVVGRINS